MTDSGPYIHFDFVDMYLCVRKEPGYNLYNPYIEYISMRVENGGGSTYLKYTKLHGKQQVVNDDESMCIYDYLEHRISNCWDLGGEMGRGHILVY